MYRFQPTNFHNSWSWTFRSWFCLRFEKRLSQSFRIRPCFTHYISTTSVKFSLISGRWNIWSMNTSTKQFKSVSLFHYNKPRAFRLSFSVIWSLAAGDWDWKILIFPPATYPRSTLPTSTFLLILDSGENFQTPNLYLRLTGIKITKYINSPTKYIVQLIVSWSLVFDSIKIKQNSWYQ